jgi:hypothetical protein
MQLQGLTNWGAKSCRKSGEKQIKLGEILGRQKKEEGMKKQSR